MPPTLDRASSVAVTALAVARLIRLVTTDDLGGWAVRDPAYRWAGYDPDGYELRTGGGAVLNPPDWKAKLVSGLECPWCVGYWLGVVVLTFDAAAPRSRLWRFTKAGLALNYVVAQVSSRLD